jgi:hypothetical protein
VQISNYFYCCTKISITSINANHKMNKTRLFLRAISKRNTCWVKHPYIITLNMIIHSLLVFTDWSWLISLRFLHCSLLSTDILQLECPCPTTLK